MEDRQAQTQIENVELNQFGRPKQAVIFYDLTAEMKNAALLQLEKDEMVKEEKMYEKAEK